LHNERDRALLRRIADRDRSAFEALYSEYHRRLARFLGRLTQRQDLIEEAVNDTLWVVWQKAPEFRGASAPSTWIMGIAWRCALKALRRAGHPGEPLSETDAGMATPASTDDQERHDWILSGLKHLPLEQRTALELAYYLGHSCEEIAQIMDCPVSTVKARMFHARVKLRNLLPRLGGLKDAL
jgi:RNA polymerase sigma-70 factor (ECF subfamily)